MNSFFGYLDFLTQSKTKNNLILNIKGKQRCKLSQVTQDDNI
jgi:hypothetical protein